MTGLFLKITAPLGVLGGARSTLPERTEIEFESTASTPGRSISSLHVSGTGIEHAITGFRDNPFVDDVSFVTETVDGQIYQLTWGDTLPDLIEQIRDADGTILTAVAEDDTWTFELRFPEPAAASRFYSRYDDPNRPITIHRTSPNESSQRVPRDVLTPKQRDALVRAVAAGYFEIPRRTTLVKLADDLGVSDSAASQRLRRGLLSILRDPTFPPIATTRSVLDDDD